MHFQGKHHAHKHKQNINLVILNHTSLYHIPGTLWHYRITTGTKPRFNPTSEILEIMISHSILSGIKVTDLKITYKPQAVKQYSHSPV